MELVIIYICVEEEILRGYHAQMLSIFWRINHIRHEYGSCLLT